MLNLLDYIIILFLLWKGWRGMKNGLIIELGGVIILYISFIISTGNNIVTDLSNKTMIILNISPDFKWLFSFVFIYIILFILLRLLNNAITGLSLGFINKFLGGVFGILKWWLILNIVVFILLFINTKTSNYTQKNIFDQKIFRTSFIVKTMYSTASNYIE